MIVKLKLDTAAKMRKNGFPIKIEIYIKGKRKRIGIKKTAFLKDWDKNKQLPLPTHPDYEYLFPVIIELHNVIKEINYKKIKDFSRIEKMLKIDAPNNTKSFSEFMEQMAIEREKIGKYKSAYNYRVAIRQFESILQRPVDFDDINYKTLLHFKNSKLGKVSNNTIYSYLRLFRSGYNEAIRRNLTEDTQPFRGVFAGLSIRNSMQRKKYIDKKDIAKLENAELSGVSNYVRDLFLLQFYFGGQDLKDIYYLSKNKINDNRAYFERAKLAGRGYVFDLKIFEKTNRIMKKYTGSDGYIFPGRKDYTGYNTFYRRYLRYLHEIQTKLDIKVLPLGGKLGSKVSRHTFANIGKRLFIEEDILRELMGHERNDIDNYYKDKYPADVRDVAHWKIIDTTNLM